MIKYANEREAQAAAALKDCLDLIDDMSRFVGQMALRDYKLFNEAPIKAARALKMLHRTES